MARTICYDEVCRPEDKIHLRNAILLTLSFAVVVTAVFISQQVYSELAGLDFSLFTIDF